MAMRHVFVLAGASAAPSRARKLIEVAEIAALHHIVQSTATISVIVVVALPDVSERINGRLIVIAEIVAEYFKITSVELATKDHPAPVRAL